MALFEHFPYTNFHELNLDWILGKMKELDGEMDTLSAAVTALRKWFDNLDVTDEVRQVLEEMLDNGELDDIIHRVMSEYEAYLAQLIDAQNTRLDVLEGRMDTFASLPSGSTSGNAELMDIRTTYWGETEASAGDAVRKQYEVLSDNYRTNLIYPTRPGTNSANGLNWTWNGDGSLTISGTATATTTIQLNGSSSASQKNLEDGYYTVQRWIVRGSGNVRFARIVGGSAVILIGTLDKYAHANFTMNSADGGVYLQVGNQQTVNGTYRFMVSSGTDNLIDYTPAVQFSACDAVARLKAENALLAVNQGVKWRYVTYPAASPVQGATEGLEILVNDSILYQLVHSVDAGSRCDVWRIAYAYKSDSNFNKIAQLTTSGEWECAIRAQGWSDFSGGWLHKHEWKTNVTDNINPCMIADGSVIGDNWSTYEAIQSCGELVIYEHTNMQSPDRTNATIDMRHTRIYRFNKDGLTLSQWVQFNSAQTISKAYMAMLPAAKARFNGWIDDSAGSAGYRTLTGATDYTFTHAGARHAVLGGDYGSLTFDVPEYPTFDTAAAQPTFLISDNGGNQYHKAYYEVPAEGRAVNNSEFWHSVTKYIYTT